MPQARQFQQRTPNRVDQLALDQLTPEAVGAFVQVRHAEKSVSRFTFHVFAFPAFGGIKIRRAFVSRRPEQKKE